MSQSSNRSERLLLGDAWGQFCADLGLCEVETNDPTVGLIKALWSDFESSADFSARSGYFQLRHFRCLVEARGQHNQLNSFLDRYLDRPEADLSFHEEPERRITQVRDRVRYRVWLKRLMLPLEVHDRNNYAVDRAGWDALARQILQRTTRLSFDEVKQFAAGITRFKRDLLEPIDVQQRGGEETELEQVLRFFYQDYIDDHDTRIDDEMEEVTYFFERAGLSDEQLSEVINFYQNLEELFIGSQRYSEPSKREPDKPAPEFTHPLHISRLAFGGLEVAQTYPELVPAEAEKFWQQLVSPRRKTTMAFRVGSHDVLEDEDKIRGRTGIIDVPHHLQAWYVEAADRMLPEHERAAWVDGEEQALQRLNAKRDFGEQVSTSDSYRVYILELLEHGQVTDLYVKMCDVLHNMSSPTAKQVNGYGRFGRFAAKLRDTEPLIEKALEVGFFWFMPMRTLKKVFESHGQPLLETSPGWRQVYEEIYLPRHHSTQETLVA